MIYKISLHVHLFQRAFYAFLFKKISMSTWSGWRRERNRFSISPAAEKTLSAGTDVAVVLWWKCETSRPAEITTLFIAVSLKPSLIASWRVWAKQGFESHSRNSLLTRTMLLALSCTHAVTFPFKPQDSVAFFSTLAKFSAVCLSGIARVCSTTLFISQLRT